MKRACVLFTGLFLIFTRLAAMEPPEGRYRYELNARVRTDNNYSHRCSNYFMFYVTFSGESEQELLKQDLNAIGVDKNWRDCPAFVFYKQASSRLVNYRFYGKRKWRNRFGCVDKKKGSSDVFSFPVSAYPCETVVIDDKIPFWSSYVTLSIFPEKIDLYYHDYKGTYRTTDLVLLDKKKIMLKATKGFAAAAYAWQYAVKGRSVSEAWTDVEWKAVPSSLYNGSVASFSGNDLMGEEAFRTVLKEKKLIAVKIAGFTESPLMILDPRLYAPKLVRTEIETPSCSYGSDGKIKVYFDRALLTGETVEIALRKWEEYKPDQIPSPSQSSTFATGHWVGAGSVRLKQEEASCVIPGLSSGRYKIQISQGAYPDDYPGYVADGTDHELNDIEVAMVADPDLESVVAVGADCYGGKNGRITLRATGGKGNLYLLYTPTDSMPLSRGRLESVSGLKAGEYALRLHGANGCTARENNAEKVWKIKVGQPGTPVKVQQLSEPVNPSGYGLSNGSIAVVASGGSGGYVYEWKKDNSLLSSLTGSSHSSLGKGTYSITVRDGRYRGVQPSTAENTAGCVASVNITLTQPDLLRAAVAQTKEVTCYGTLTAAMEASGTGGVSPYTYQWQKQNGSTWGNLNCTTRSCPDIGAGTYRVRIRDKNNNEAYSSALVVKEPAELTIDFSTVLPSCNGDADGQVTAMGRGGTSPYSYFWPLSGETTERIVAEAGEYYVRVTDANGCQTAGSVTLSEPDVLQVRLVPRHLLCKYDTDGEITACLSGGTEPYFYRWSGNQTTSRITHLPEGFYRVDVSDSHGCRAWDTVSILSPEELVVTLGFLPPLGHGRSDGAVWTEVAGGVQPYRYQWLGSLDDTTGRVDGVPAGVYEVEVTDEHECKKRATVTVTQPPLLEAFITQTAIVSCKGRHDARLEASARGGVSDVYRFTWYAVREGRGTELCRGVVADELPAGMYRLKVTDENGIEAWAAEYEVTEPDVLAVKVQGNEIACNGEKSGEMRAFVSGGTPPYRYFWTSGDTTAVVKGLADGAYLVLVSDAHDCREEALGEVVVPGGLEADAEVIFPVCYGDRNGAIRIEVSGGVAPYAVRWQDTGHAALLRDSLPAGEYTVNVTDAYGCFKHFTYRLSEPLPLEVELGSDRTLCRGQLHELRNLKETKEAVSWHWYRDGVLVDSRSPVLTAEREGHYRLEIRDADGCRGSGEVSIWHQETDIAVNFAMASEVGPGDVLKLVNTTVPAPERWEWLIPDMPEIEVLNEGVTAEMMIHVPGRYTLGLRSVVGECEAVLYKEVTVAEYSAGEGEKRVAERRIRDVKLWPNPNKGQFRVRVELNETAPVRFFLYTQHGVLVKQEAFEGLDTYEWLQESFLPLGLYIVQVICGKERETVKVMVEP